MFIYNTRDKMDLMFAAGSMPKLEELETRFNGVKTEAFTGGNFDFGVENLTHLTAIRCWLVGAGSVDTINAAKAAIKGKVGTLPNHPTLAINFW
jgi:hypothetical protein